MNRSPNDPSTALPAIHWCDLFRDLEHLPTTDPRYASRSVMDPRVGARPMTLEDHWRDIEAIALHDGVPRSIRVHFDTARNILLHSWYVYRFQQVGEVHAYASVEYALRIRAGLPPRSTARLPKLLPLAVKNGWIRDDGFRHYRRAAERMTEPVEIEAMVAGREPEPTNSDGRSYVRMLARLLPKSRNNLAHGTAMMRPSGKATLALCCDLINQLFPVT